MEIGRQRHKDRVRVESLSQRILQLTGLIIGGVALSILIVFVTVSIIYQRQVLRLNTQQAVEIVRNTSVAPLEFLEFLALYNNLAELNKVTDFDRIEVFDRFHFSRATIGEDQPTDPDFEIPVYDNTDRFLGTVHIWGDPSKALSQKIYMLIASGVVVLVLVFFVTASLLRMMLKNNLIAPLRTLGRDIIDLQNQEGIFSEKTLRFKETRDIALSFDEVHKNWHSETEARLAALHSQHEEVEKRLKQTQILQRVLNEIGWGFGYTEFDAPSVSLCPDSAPEIIKSIVANPQFTFDEMQRLMENAGEKAEISHGQNIRDREDDAYFTLRVTLGANEDWTIRKLRIDQSQYVVFAINDSELRDMERALSFKQKMEALGVLSAGVAHDFNNILAIILASVELAMTTSNNTAKHELKNAIYAIQRAKNLVRQLQPYSNKKPEEATNVDINELINNFRETFPAMLGPNIKLTILPFVKGAAFCDRTLLEIAFTNLAVNAREAMPQGGEICIGAQWLSPQNAKKLQLEQQKDYVHFQIIDNGKGIPKDIEERIFEPFYTTKEKGSGLGLSMVYDFAQRNDGILYYTPNTPRGSIFHLIVPKGDANKAKPLNSQFEASHALNLKPDEHFLVLDDEKLFVKSILRYWELSGIHCYAAHNLDEFYHHLEQNGEPKLVLSDLHLREGSGLEAITYLKKNYPSCKTILMSGCLDAESLNKSEAKPDTLLNKPFKMNELQTIVALLFEDTRTDATKEHSH